jgi:hypothetical protein
VSIGARFEHLSVEAELERSLTRYEGVKLNVSEQRPDRLKREVSPLESVRPFGLGSHGKTVSNRDVLQMKNYEN